MSDNDPKDRKAKEDLTRIEDLSDFFHNEDEDFSDLDNHSEENDDFEDRATDPDLTLPPDFSTEDDSTDFSALEDDEEDDSPPSLPEESTQTFNLPDEHSEEDSFDTEENNFDSLDDENQFDNDENDFSSGENDFDTEENDFESASDGNEFGSEESDFGTEDNDFDSGEIEFGTDDNEFGSLDTEFEEEDSFDTEENNFGTFDNEDDNAFNTDEEENEQVNEDFGALDEDSEESLTPLAEQNDQLETEDSSELEEPDFLQEQIKEEVEEKPIPPKTEIPRFEDEKAYKAPENFQELQNFSKNMSYGNMAREGNPPFSIILKDIKYQEDLEDILILLKEFKITSEENEEQAKEALTRGSYLIPRLGEYAAITLCHKLRRFDLNILMGLTEEIHPAKSYDSDDRGLATKNNIFNNRKHNWNFEEANLTIDDLLTSTTSTLEGHEILDYISVETEYTVINASELRSQSLEEQSEELNNNSLKHIYKDLLNKLKSSALNKKANAIIGITYQTTPISNQSNQNITTQYQIICSGSFVWVTKR